MPLHVLLTQEAPGRFTAHCLELDIVADAGSADEALDDLAELIQSQLEFAAEHNNLENVFVPAPKEYWQRALLAPRIEGHRVIEVKVSAKESRDPDREGVKTFELATSGLCYG